MRKERWLIEWANGFEETKGINCYDAIRNIKTNLTKVNTGFLIRLRKQDGGQWQYLDSERFWKELKKSKFIKGANQ